MKLLKYILIISIVVSFTACEDYFGENANVDQDNPTVVTANVILPQVQARLAYTYGGDITRYVGLNTQHVDGISRQFAVLGNYGITGSDTETMWNNIYSGSMNSNKQLLAVAEEGGFNHYAGIAHALESFAMLTASDIWGDIPYSDAFKFGEVGLYQPTFDSQESVYQQVLSTLDKARTALAADSGGNSPGSDDLIYGGNISQWIKFCNVLEARAQLHLSNRSGNYSAVLAALDKGGFADSGDDFDFAFGAAATENAPWSQYIDQRDDCEVGAAYVAILGSFGDPRQGTYGQPHDASNPIFTPDQTVEIVNYTEQEFIRAEALLGTDRAGAYAAYLEGIKSSFTEALLPDAYDAYVAQGNVGVGMDNLSLQDVITQKYIALYTNPEVFSDWRRTNMPALTPIVGSSIPRRVPYPTAEVLANPNTPRPSSITIFDSVWWDN